MAKDPAFLFYYQDWLVGTSFMTNEQKGIYIDMLCHQAHHGTLTQHMVDSICPNKDDWKVISEKFTHEEHYWYNERLMEEMNKRKLFSESRRKNRLGKTRKSSIPHMENENENENEGKNGEKIKKKSPFKPPTLAELHEYTLEKDLDVDIDKFWDFYESKGWMIGKNKMKSWQAAVRNWARQGNSPSAGAPAGGRRSEPPPAPDLESQLRRKNGKADGR